MEHKINLTFGYKDKKGDVHKDITFGRRLTVGDMMLLDSDPQAQNPTQYSDLIHRRAITAFGALTMPVPLDAMLSLNSIDRKDLEAGFDAFIELTRDGRKPDFHENNVVKLCFGFEIDGTVYNIVDLGKLNTGRDEADADAVATSGVIRECFLLGRRISRISTEDGSVSIDGPVELDKFKDLDATDLNLLRIGARIAEQFFRLKGAGISEERTGESGDPDITGNGDVGSGDPGSADTENK